jgi:hypothetical protein
MSLEKKTAGLIVDVVRKDAECNRRTQSFLRRLPDTWMQAGGIRDFLMWGQRTGGNVLKFAARSVAFRAARNSPSLKGSDESDSEYSDLECTGIADAAVKALNSALKGKPGIPDVAAVIRVDRIPVYTTRMNLLSEMAKSLQGPIGLGPILPNVSAKPTSVVAGNFHSAVGVTMRDGTQYVFDWFLTLNVRDPVIFFWNIWQIKGFERSGVPFSIFRGYGDSYGIPPKA